MPFELPVERPAAHTKEPGGNGLIAVDHFQGACDMFTSDVDKRRRRNGPSGTRYQLASGWQALFDGVHRCSEILVAGHQNGFALRADVAERPEDVIAGNGSSDQRQDGAVVIHDKQTRTDGHTPARSKRPSSCAATRSPVQMVCVSAIVPIA